MSLFRKTILNRLFLVSKKENKDQGVTNILMCISSLFCEAEVLFMLIFLNHASPFLCNIKLFLVTENS